MWVSLQEGYLKGVKSGVIIGQANPGIVVKVEVSIYEKRKVKRAPPI